MSKHRLKGYSALHPSTLTSFKYQPLLQRAAEEFE